MSARITIREIEPGRYLLGTGLVATLAPHHDAIGSRFRCTCGMARGIGRSMTEAIAACYGDLAAQAATAVSRWLAAPAEHGADLDASWAAWPERGPL